MIRLDAATVLLQWATGGLLFLWVTTRRREVGLGYGWLLRASFGGARHPGARGRPAGRTPTPRRDGLALADRRRRAGRARRVGRPPAGRGGRSAGPPGAGQRPGGGHDRHRPRASQRFDVDSPEFPPAPRPRRPGHRRARRCSPRRSTPAGRCPLATLRFLVGAAFSGRSPTPCCWATGTWSSRAWRGPRWSSWCAGPSGSGRSRCSSCCCRPAWCRCSAAPSTTAGAACSAGCGWSARSRRSASCVVTRAALKERQYSAVMAATGLLYLAILTAFGMDLVAPRRARRLAGEPSARRPTAMTVVAR